MCRPSSAAASATTTIAQQRRLSRGAPFPAVLSPPKPSHNWDAPDFRQLMEERLRESGAVLLRGFQGLATAADFDRFISSLGGVEFPYTVGGEATRQRITGRVFTANDGIPLHKAIGFHNEVAYLERSPSRIMFFCERAPPEGCGGSTPIAHGRSVYERLALEGHQQFLDELEEKGVRYTKRLLPGGAAGSWGYMFKTSDKNEAYERALKIGARLEWLDDGAAIFHSGRCPAIKVDPHTGDKVWFNTIHGIQLFKSFMPNGGFDAMFGDGSPFPKASVDACMRVLDDVKVGFPWQQGDVLIVDNAMVLHARQPCTSESRTILVALST